MTVNAEAHAHQLPMHPALRRTHDERHERRQLRIADAITSFAGSMRFVSIHVAWFGVWIAINLGPWRFDEYPFGLLTMIVSLEAIFLSTFVMISQNRADEKRQAMADHEWMLVQTEEKQNRELLDLSHQILDLTRQVHGLVTSSGGRPRGRTTR
jgi:uncharacterized membrane protein